MSRNGKSPKLDLKLNLSPPRTVVGSPASGGSSPSSMSSSPSSCVSTEPEGSPDVGSMTLVGCPRCLMYVMLSEKDPRCPKCKSTVLLDFVQQQTKGKKSSGKS